MKRRQAVYIIQTLFLLLPVLTAYSQLQLLESEHGLRAGDSLTVQVVEPFSPGAPGCGRIWDLSGVGIISEAPAWCSAEGDGMTVSCLDLPSVIQFADNSYIGYTYDAAGQKLRTRYGVQPGIGPLTPAGTGGAALGGGTAGTDAVGTNPSPDELSRMGYCGNMVYDRGERRLLLGNGYVTFDIATNAPFYHFYLRDHLGNNRMVMARDGTVEQVTHYYPFGGVMRESTNPGLQPYNFSIEREKRMLVYFSERKKNRPKVKYGGKELDRTSGLDAYDFGARMYFADRMQWGQMDPMC